MAREHLGHGIRTIVAPHGIARGGVVTCECGWSKPYDRLQAALAAHERHQFFAKIFAKAFMVFA